MLQGQNCILKLDETNQELNATGDSDFGCLGYDEAYGDGPGDDLPWHWHEGFEAILCLEGTFELQVSGKSVALAPGEAAFVNAWCPHAAAGAPRARIRSVVFDDPFVSGGTGTAIARRYVEPLKTGSGIDLLVFGAGNDPDDGEKGFAWHLAQALEALEAEAPGFEIATRSHLSQAFLCAWRQAGSPEPAAPADSVAAERTALMRDHIAAHFAEKLTVGQIAAAAGVSERECLRCFTKTFGVSPSRYLLMHRLNKAAELLVATDLPVAEVGRAVGIASPSNFAQLFRRDYHCTPRAFRARARG